MTDTLLIPDSHRDLAGVPNTIALSTLNADGSIQTTAVWALVEEGIVRMSLATARQKYRNLVARPEATLFAVDPANPYRTLEVRATVTIEFDDAEHSFQRRVFAAYGMEPSAELLAEERVVVTFHATRINTMG
jgi:PPOX class probable F420-dependent enzyme